MARPLRLDLKNIWYHVANGGNNRQAVYLDEGDRKPFLDLLFGMIERYSVEVHAYVLMGNQYHLIVRTPEANLSAAVQWLNVAAGRMDYAAVAAAIRRFKGKMAKDEGLRDQSQGVLRQIEKL